MKRFSLLILIFAILTMVFILLLIFLRIPFPLYPLVSYQDAFDILTPLILIPIYWLLYKHSGNNEPNPAGELAFMVLAAVWVEGHGIHLAANAINNLSEALARSKVMDITASDIYRLAYFFDEHLGHYMWHIGMVGLAAVLIHHEWQHPAEQETSWGTAIAAGILYGFSYFCIFIEGQTVALGLPFAVIIILFTLILGRGILAKRPLLAFFFVSFVVAVLLFTVWGVYWHGFPQFTDVGLL
jgi:hypothetical protein